MFIAPLGFPAEFTAMCYKISSDDDSPSARGVYRFFVGIEVSGKREISRSTSSPVTLPEGI